MKNGIVYCVLLVSLFSCDPHICSLTAKESFTEPHGDVAIDSICEGLVLLYSKSGYVQFNCLISNASNTAQSINLDSMVFLEQTNNRYSLVKVVDLKERGANYKDSLITHGPRAEKWFVLGYKSAVLFEKRADWIDNLSKHPLSYYLRDSSFSHVLKKGVLIDGYQ